jgi:hypothetical protein
VDHHPSDFGAAVVIWRFGRGIGFEGDDATAAEPGAVSVLAGELDSQALVANTVAQISKPNIDDAVSLLERRCRVELFKRATARRAS